MKRFLMILGLSWAAIANLSALPNIFPQVDDGELYFGLGYRQDNLKWSIASPSGTPNILSELEWKDLKIGQVILKGDLELCNHIYFRGYADYGQIRSGKNRDSDYAGNDKTFEFSRVEAKANKGEVFDLSAGVGYKFHWYWNPGEDEFTFAPLVGYSHFEQHLQQRDGKQIVNLSVEDGSSSSDGSSISDGSSSSDRSSSSSSSDSIGIHIDDLHSNYKAKWKGPWAGFDWSYSYCEIWKFYGSFEYHWGKYHGKGHWNLREDFIKDFRQDSSHIRGPLVNVGFVYEVWCGWLTGLDFTYQSIRSGSGKDRVFTVDGSPKTRFNGVKWRSYSISGIVGWSF